MSSKPELTLIPWDPDSVAHRSCLLRQREECSWGQDKVEIVWREQQIKGDKCIYWIVLPSDESLAAGQIAESSRPNLSKEDDLLQDTATAINTVAREPTETLFMPIGHISLDAQNPDAAGIELGLPLEGVYWIKTFFVRQIAQGQGIGRAAMDAVEDMATREPLNARILMLDTVQKDDQKREEFALATYGEVPKFTNEEWYARRGYQLIKTVQNFYNILDKNGKVWDTRTVFMKKEIS